MHRALYFVGVGYLAICGLLVLRHELNQVSLSQPVQASAGVQVPEQGWWQRVRTRCNPVEVELAHRMLPPPATLEGQGYSAACYALAGKLDSARAIIDRLRESDRYRAVGIVFNEAHPIADAGDDRAAGPIMELVVHYWPNHYMALYHAGMAEYMLGQYALARKNLEAFLRIYQERDGWRSNAIEILKRLDDPSGRGQEQRRPREPGL